MKITYFLLLILIFNFQLVFAEELFITFTDADSEIIFDGKWSNTTEWKKSSQTIVKQDDESQFVLRYAHNYEQIFFLVDVINDNSANSLKDKSILCFEKKIDENNFSNSIYCFEKIFDGDLVTMIKSFEMSEFKIIENPKNTLATSNMSDEYDRYSKVPHVSYEFQIPVDVIGRSDVYKFYAAVFDSETNQIITWPQNSEDLKSFITSSDHWGLMISPDKSIPEFSSPFIIMIILIGLIVLVRFKTNVNPRLF